MARGGRLRRLMEVGISVEQWQRCDLDVSSFCRVFSHVCRYEAGSGSVVGQFAGENTGDALPHRLDSLNTSND